MRKEKCRLETIGTSATFYAWRSAQNRKTSNKSFILFRALQVSLTFYLAYVLQKRETGYNAGVRIAAAQKR